MLTHVYSSFKQFAVLEECFRNQRLQSILFPQNYKKKKKKKKSKQLKRGGNNAAH